MSAPKSGHDPIQAAINCLGPGPWSEAVLVTHIHPLFSNVLKRQEIYLANHSLGRPLDQTTEDVRHGLNLWYEKMDNAWEDWLACIADYRHMVARVINAPRDDCIVPKTNAGQSLRTILNCYEEPIGVLTTKDEFNSIDHILKIYAQRNRIHLTQVGPSDNGVYEIDDLIAALNPTISLVVISMVLFTTGQWLQDLSTLIDAAHSSGTRLLVDLYHAAGVVPVDIQSMNADFAIGGCYKYLRGGPGACWLYIHPRHLDGSLVPLDTGWFAQPKPFDFQRSDTAQLATGGDGFLESTPPVLPFYQSKAGLAFTLALGVENIRAHSLKQQALLIELLARHRLTLPKQPKYRGAFLTLAHSKADKIAIMLREKNIIVDAREGLIRLCPDILTTEQELDQACAQLVHVMDETNALI